MAKRRKHSNTINLFGLHDQDVAHHILLVIILLAGFIGIVYATNEPMMQFMIGLTTAVLYVAWGVFHHYHDGDLHMKSVIEYVLLASLGILILAVLFL